MSGWYYAADGGEIQGPFNDEQFKDMAFRNVIAPTTRVVHSENTKNQWVEMQRIKGLMKHWDDGRTKRPPAIVATQQIAKAPQADPRRSDANDTQKPVAIQVNLPGPEERLRSVGWFTRAFGTTAGIIIAVIAIPCVICAALCGGCMLMTAGASKVINEADKTAKEQTAASDQQSQKILALFVVDGARFYYTNDLGLRTPSVQLSVTNKTGEAVSTVTFKGKVTSQGRTIPWAEGDFSYEIPGGLEPGESANWSLSMNMFSEWAKVPSDRSDLQFIVSPKSLLGPGGKVIAQLSR